MFEKQRNRAIHSDPIALSVEQLFSHGRESSIAHVEAVLQNLTQHLDPLGTSLESFGRLARNKDVSLWPEDAVPGICHGSSLCNSAIVLAEAMQLDIQKCHPARLFLVFKTVGQISLRSTQGYLQNIFALIADDQIEALGNTLHNRFKECRISQRSSSNPAKESEFLSASAFPFAETQSFERLFESFFREDIFGGADNDPEIIAPPDSWGYITTKPQHLVRFLSTLPSPASGRCIDLGAGRGALLFMLKHLTTMQLEGVDIDGRHILQAEKDSKAFGISDINFSVQDVRDYKVQNNDTLFIYSPFRKEEPVREFVKHLERETEGKNIKIWSPDVMPFTAVLNEQSWLQSGHRAGFMGEYIRR